MKHSNSFLYGLKCLIYLICFGMIIVLPIVICTFFAQIIIQKFNFNSNLIIMSILIGLFISISSIISLFKRILEDKK